MRHLHVSTVLLRFVGVSWAVYMTRDLTYVICVDKVLILLQYEWKLWKNHRKSVKRCSKARLPFAIGIKLELYYQFEANELLSDIFELQSIVREIYAKKYLNSTFRIYYISSFC